MPSATGDYSATGSGKDVEHKNQDNSIWRQFDSIYDGNKEALEKYTKRSEGTRGDKIAEVEQKIDGFAETAGVILDVLNELGKIHPVISVAVMAFRGVLRLDISRRENDRKVIVILVEMQNMMCAMLELRHLRRTANNGQEDDSQRRMGIDSANFRELIKGITSDITRCGSDLNYYLSQNPAFKFLKAKNFESAFKAHVERFAHRRSELQLAITTYIAGGVDQLTSTTGEISSNVQTLDFKVAVIFDALMRKLDTREEREASKLIEAHGGSVDACLAQDEALGRLLSILGDVVPESQMKAAVAVGSRREDQDNDTVKLSRRILQDEMRKDFNESLLQNSLRFDKLLAVQEVSNDPVIAQLAQQGMYQEFTLEKLDQLISYLRPHADIDDSELRRIWDDMGLKTSVKAKKFVLKFRDHYQDAQLRNVSTNDGKGKSGTPWEPVNTEVDELLLEYIDAAHSRAIIEAMDMDGSGYISVKELNSFCRLKPKEWSLLQWMAYWAVGWHINTIHYRDMIYDLLIQMHETLPLVHFANRVLVDQYLVADPLAKIEGMLRFTKDVTDENPNSLLKQHAKQYREIQENSLIAILETLSYRISSPEDLKLIGGGQRPESWVYPLLYLVLTRHFAVIKLAKWCILDEREMSTHQDALENIFLIIEKRKDALQASITGRFDTFACGMLYASYMGDKEVSAAKNTLARARTKKSDQEVFQIFYKETPSDYEYRPHKAILACQVTPELEYTPTNIGRSADPAPGNPSLPILPIAGYWSGIQFFSEDEATAFMGLFHLIIAVSADGVLSGFGEAYVGHLKLSGTISIPKAAHDAPSAVEFCITCEGTEIFFRGFYDSGKATLSGNWDPIEKLRPNFSPGLPTLSSASPPSARGAQSSPTSGFVSVDTERRFLMTRCPVEYVRYASITDIGSSSVARKRWVFAIEATRHQVSKQDPWRYVMARLAERKLWVKLSIKEALNGSLPVKERDALNKMKAEYHPAQGRFFEELAGFLERRSYALNTGEVYCDCCGEGIIFDRFRCITCVLESLENQIDLCVDNAACISSPLTSRYLPDSLIHSPSHTLLQVKHFIHKCDISTVLTLCRSRSESIKRRYRRLDEIENTSKKGSVAWVGKASAPSQTSAQPLLCACCGMEVSLPCWVCAICVDTAICLTCEEYGAGVKTATARSTAGDESAPIHSQSHSLLRIHDSKEVQPADVTKGVTDPSALMEGLRSLETLKPALEASIDTRIAALQTAADAHVASLDSKISVMHDRISSLDSRMSGIENQLSQVLALLQHERL